MTTSNHIGTGNPTHGRPGSAWLNWTLALLTALGAAVVYVAAMAGVMGTAGCTEPSTSHCPPAWLNEQVFGVLIYGPAVVAVLTIAISFYSATRPRGIVVPLCAWALLVIDFGVLAVAFAG